MATSPTGSDAGGNDAAPASIPDAGSAVDAGTASAYAGTVHYTYTLDNEGEKTFDCAPNAVKRQFIHHTVASGGSITVACDDGAAPGSAVISGMSAPTKTGTFDESDFSAVLFQRGALILDSQANGVKASDPPEHTVVISTWDAATNHAVGVATVPKLTYGGHTLALKIEFDVTCVEQP